MSMRWMAIAIVVVGGGLGYLAWRMSSTPPRPGPAEMGGMPEGGMGMPALPEAGDPGIEWGAPAGWELEPGRGMRLATYTVPGAGGAGEATCAVFYFGPGQGGGTEPNIQRWIGEFENPTDPERTSRKVGGLTVSRVRVKGSYASHAGAGGEGPGALEGQELLGAIVEGPAGSVFFKLTGPAATVGPAAAGFDRMLSSVRRR